MGTTPYGVGKPIFRSSRYRMTPDAASRPNALPPASTMAWTWSTRLRGFSRSVSRVPGAEPRTSTPATAPPSARTTVQPVGLDSSVCWPTLRPATAVRPRSLEPLMICPPAATTSASASTGRTPPHDRVMARLTSGSRRGPHEPRGPRRWCRQSRRHARAWRWRRRDCPARYCARPSPTSARWFPASRFRISPYAAAAPA